MLPSPSLDDAYSLSSCKSAKTWTAVNSNQLAMFKYFSSLVDINHLRVPCLKFLESATHLKMLLDENYWRSSMVRNIVREFVMRGVFFVPRSPVGSAVKL